MKILGLFIVVFAALGILKVLGFSDMAMMVGAIVGAGTYILTQITN